MKINDEEDLLRSIRLFVMANLNTKILAINTEKNDEIILEEIEADNDHYLFSGETIDLPNHAFVNFAIEGEIEVRNNYDDKISLPSFLVEICFSNPVKPGTYFKSLRYMRALCETIIEFEAAEIDQIQLIKALPMFVTWNNKKLVISGAGISFAI